MAVIDKEGLFKGKRLRRCSAAARWRWPYLFLMSNGYARIELDYESLADEFSSFREFAPTPDELRETFSEFRANHLLFVYTVNDQEWGQWDCRRTLLKDYKTAADSASPKPPESEYRSWLKEQHGEDWREFHWSKEAIEETLGQHLPKTLPSAPQSFQAERYGVGVGEGKGKGKENTAPDFNSTEAAQYVCQELDLAGNELRWMVRDVIDGELKKSAGSTTVVAEAMVSAWRKYSTIRKGMKFTKGIKAFFSEAGFWKDEDRWMHSGDTPATPKQPSPTDEAKEQERLQALENELKEEGRRRREEMRQKEAANA